MMRERTVICEGSNINKVFRLVKDLYTCDALDENNNLITTNILAMIKYKLQVKILGFYITIKSYRTHTYDNDIYLYKTAVSDFNRLVD